MVQRIAIVGLGLIGGSLARAVQARLPDISLTVTDTDEATRRQAAADGMKVAENAAEAARGAELVALAVPVPALAAAARAMAPGLGKGAIVTDVASCKRVTLREVAPCLPEGVVLVPGHPIAGTEKRGYGASFPTLFDGKKAILTPEAPDQQGLETVASLWKGIGAKVEYMPPDLHDRIYACVSHLPQYLAFQVKELFSMFHVKQSGGEVFRRFTRLCDSPPALWRGIFAANADYLGEMRGRYLEVLRLIRAELEQGAAAQAAKPVTEAEAAAVLFPQVAASCLVSVAYRLERELGVPVARFADTGFVDFTAPAAAEPEAALAGISAGAGRVARLLDDFALRIGQES